MKTDTDLPLKWWDTARIQRELDNVQSLLLAESFGREHEAYYELMEERSKLFRELKRRNAALQ